MHATEPTQSLWEFAVRRSSMTRRRRTASSTSAPSKLLKSPKIASTAFTTVAMAVFVASVCSSVEASDTWVRCAPDAGGGVCPERNTCCGMPSHYFPIGIFDRGGANFGSVFSGVSPPTSSRARSGCIPRDMGEGGTCCPDGLTACAAGYDCTPSSPSRKYSVSVGGAPKGEAGGACRRKEGGTSTRGRDDPLVKVMPRYALCSPPPGTLEVVHGLPMGPSGSGPRAAYYSSRGDIVASGDSKFHDVKMALIVIHGAGRNADDYYCSGTIAASLQEVYPPESVLVIAPRFLTEDDGPVAFSGSSWSPMTWRGSQLSGKASGKSGTWRYGASPVSPPEAAKFSSYDVADKMLEVLGSRKRFPNLTNVAVAGHSAGGQFVQRWALLSSSPLWNDDGRRAGDEKVRIGLRTQRAVVGASPPSLRAVVANPSSYAYLDDRRYIDGKFQVPNATTVEACPNYDRWEWGLSPGGDIFVPYKERALSNAKGTEHLAQRFANRDIIYLSGGADRCDVSMYTKNGWCYSHGLETECVDAIQGRNRFERSANYFASLKEFFGREVHERRVVPGVGHDHSLMFTQPVGLSALFGHDGRRALPAGREKEEEA